MSGETFSNVAEGYEGEHESCPKTRIPTLYIKAGSIPQAVYRTIKAVSERGHLLRTQYDRKNAKGEFIDPPGTDARVFIEITNPFAQPRFPVISYSEVGKYIAEVLGAKDHLVVPHGELLEMIHDGKEFEPTQWPYCYHQRLTDYPGVMGKLNQLEMITDKLAADPITRRAVAITGVPEIDLFMKQDMPCLREIQLRALEGKEGELVLHTFTRWRSRDLYKAWTDNVLALTNLIQIEVVPRLAQKTGKRVVIGPYSEENGSLHLYGQDYGEKGLGQFFTNFPTEKRFVARAMTSEDVKDSLVLPQLRDLKTETTWHFGEKELGIIDMLIDGYESGRFTP